MAFGSIGVVFAEFEQIRGPIPLCAYPENIDAEAQKFMAAKTTVMLYNDAFLSKTASLIDFPSLEKKGLVRTFRWADASLRGGYGQGTIILCFDEQEDVIFYKYREDFEPIFAEFIQRVRKIKDKNPQTKDFSRQLETFYTKVQGILDTLADLESKREGLQEFPTGLDESEMVSHPTKSLEESEPDYTFKIIVIGDPEVGKSSIILRYTDKAFHRSYIATVGVNVTIKNVKVDKKVVQLVLWDLAGQTKFLVLRQQLYRGAHAVVMVFDLTRSGTFLNLTKWYEDLKQNLPDFHQMKIFLCGNKNDLANRIAVPPGEVQTLAARYKIPYFETSALTGKNNNAMFDAIVRELLKSTKS